MLGQMREIIQTNQIWNQVYGTKRLEHIESLDGTDTAQYSKFREMKRLRGF